MRPLHTLNTARITYLFTFYNPGLLCYNLTVDSRKIMAKIRKVVIPVAGLGTRFLPATKAQPKEMLPLLDKPIIQYIVEEAVRAGMTDIILVTGSAKRAIEDHFDRNEYLENLLNDR